MILLLHPRGGDGKCSPKWIGALFIANLGSLDNLNQPYFFLAPDQKSALGLI